MTITNKNYFEIFSLPEGFDLDLNQLTAEYKSLQAQSHPDKFSGADDATRLQALQSSSIINDAFDTLKSPLKRAAYLLTLNGIDPEENDQNHLSESLLLQQIEWRDALDNATDEGDLNTIGHLKQEVIEEQQNCISEFHDCANAYNFVDAKPIYNKLQFIEKMLSEINRSEEKILDY
ncbi:Fe-S protein assembly co-chaperone HscB [Haliea sp. AH-315-K21]|uniref:Co-chaperone protein HscB homolog n=1 Tax=SAR86 cluster bacterium TaxID=2030880 RepID=A0A2A5CCR4_9GAMM|nr:Fe-S protein assembly co-chaperone HscB [Haliea sp. AH-315-K21]PCJ41156.1 MAG: Fe-S protein assembly co-chaperone HscB [SAR86 cluster bacterium]